MSTIKSSAEDLTLNADGSNEVKFQINAVEKASINSSGLLTSTNIDATVLTGNLPAISGASLTSLNASNLGSGTVADARLGTVPVNKGGTGATTHTANNVLVGNGTSAVGSVAPSTSGNVLTSNGSSWASTAPAGGGKCLAVAQTVIDARTSASVTSWTDISGFAVTTGTLASSSSKLLIFVTMMLGTRTTYAIQARMKITPSGGSAVYPYIGAGNTTSAYGAGTAGSTENVTMFTTHSNSGSAMVNSESTTYLYSASSTVAHTIQMEWIMESGNTGYVNRSYDDSYGNGVSSITVMEIGA